MLKKTITILLILTNISFANNQIKKHLKNYKSCFLLYDLKDEKYLINTNPKLSKNRFFPCCTNKIIISLAAIDANVLEDENAFFKWDGAKCPYPSWEKDFVLKDAFQKSVNWYFLKVSKLTGFDKINKSIIDSGYGNKKSLFPNSKIKISPTEQIAFLKKLYNNNLPFCLHAIDITKKILIIDKTANYTFSGKTGTGFNETNNKFGWFVGHFKKNKKEYLFATFIQGENASGPNAREITKDLLLNMDL
jgi:beta-lactamase class D